MSDSQSNAEDSLRKLGQRLRRGWERTRPVTQEEMEKVRQAVREQWEKDQGQTQARPPDLGSPAQPSQNTEKEKQENPQEADRGHQAKRRPRDNEHDQSHL